MTRTAPRRGSTRRRATGAFDQAAYEAEVETFTAEEGEAQYANLAGFRTELDLAPVYRRHADLFSEAAMAGLRAAAAGNDAGARRAGRLLGFAIEGHLEQTVADISDRIAVAETTAAVMWRGERIGYRQVPIRVADITDRDERNALDGRYRLAMEAINPLREERWERLHAESRALGAPDYVALTRDAAGFDPEAVADGTAAFLTNSETLYYAALRRYLALIEIEGGDASVADLAHLLRGRGWDQHFESGRLMSVVGATLGGLGIDVARQRGITLDLEPRPGKTSRAFCVPIRVPGDVRLVVQPRGGHEDYGGALHEMGHLQHYAHIAQRLAPADRYIGDASVTEGWAFVFQYLLAEPDWLEEELRMPSDAIASWLDFGAFRKLYFLRRYAAKLLYELRLHRGGPWTVHRAEYAGLLGLLTGVITPEASYLADVDDGLYAAKYLRAWQLEGSLSTSLRDRFGVTWWRSTDAGTFLRSMWRRGLGPSAENVVASLGYDHLDWRPVLRQIRAQLIGQMSGYGGPNITTRAGSRKV
ncbi:MAG: hypothetical protein ACRDFZ_05355 [Candidatus Limnocylindria bacterium]